MSMKSKLGAGVICLCALFSTSVFAVDADPALRNGVVEFDGTTKGGWIGNYGSCYNVLPQASPRTCIPEVQVGPDYKGDEPQQYINVMDPNCDRDTSAQPEFSEAVCITGEATDNFDVRVFVNSPTVANAYAWGFDEPGSGGSSEVLAGTSQDNACKDDDSVPPKHSSDLVYASTFDSEEYEFDPLSAEIKLKQGGDAKVAYYFLSEADICRSADFVLKVNGTTVPGAIGTVDDISNGIYVIFDLINIPDNAVIRLDVTGAEPKCASAAGQAYNSHLSGIFVDGTEACAEPPPGADGCTPGFWKNITKHLPAWVGYAPGQQFSSVFENAFPGMTLRQVLAQGGGGLKALGRHTVAALLNGANSDINYGMTSAEVIAAFNAVYPGTKDEYTALKNEFAYDNERGCPINGKTAPDPF